MVRFLADEDFNSIIVRGIRRRDSSIDIVRVQDVGLRTKDDTDVLEWAAEESRVVLTHDGRTMPNHAFDLVAAGTVMAGVAVVSRRLSVGQAIEKILSAAHSSDADDWQNRVLYLKP